MTQVAKKQENTAVALASMFKADAGLGTENMHGSEDLGLPFLKVLSQLSPELESVEGAKAGMIYNNVTNKVYDGSKGILCYPVHYERRHIEWQPRGQGSGAPVANHPATSDIMTRTFKKPGDYKDYLENGNYIETTAQHYILMVDEDGTTQQALVAMKSTQLKKSRKWNSMIMSTKMIDENGTAFTPASFSHAYRLFTTKESNDKGTWYGWEVEKVGPCENPSHYAEAQALSRSVAQGTVQVKHSREEDGKTVAENF